MELNGIIFKETDLYTVQRGCLIDIRPLVFPSASMVWVPPVAGGFFSNEHLGGK